MMTLILLWLTSFAYFPSSSAHLPRCMVEPKSVKNALKKSAAVFAGEVFDIKKGSNFSEVRFRVERSWKGVVLEEISVLEADNTAESPHFRLGERYLVFAGIENGTLITGNCSRTKKIEYAEGDLQQLGEGKSPKAKRTST